MADDAVTEEAAPEAAKQNEKQAESPIEVKEEEESPPEETALETTETTESAAEQQQDTKSEETSPEPPAPPPEEEEAKPEPELSPEPPSATPPSSSFHTVNDLSRQTTHGKLRAYEARRRSAYTSKLESSALYWRSFRDLLHASVHETARAERLVLGSAKANQLYANAMQATHDDSYLDDKGHVVTDPRKQKRLAEVRSSVASAEKSSMLSSLVESQAVLAERFGENSKHVSTEIAVELTALRSDLQIQVQGMERLGNAIVSELETTEKEVKGAWESYYSMAAKCMGSVVTPQPQTKHRTDSESSVDTTALAHYSDVWVVEMQYRVAVAYQSMAWEKGSTELSKLFREMKQAECERRVKLREVLIAFLNRQERLFLSLPSIQTPVLKDLVGKKVDNETIEQNVQDSIRQRAIVLQQEEAKHAKPSPRNGPGLSAVNDADANFKLESPLTSELLCKAKVIERKTTGMMASWKTTLAVVTADSFLHLFDLPSSKAHSGSAPEVAFQSLVPAVVVPTAENVKTKSFLKGWSEHLTPSESVVLSNCTITSSGNGTSFDVVETVHNTGASKMFGKVSTRKLQLKTLTEQETKDWIETLKAQQFSRTW